MSFFDIITNKNFLNFAGNAISAGTSLYTNSKATEAQTNAANQAAALTQDQFDQTRADLAPYLGVGKNALYATSALSGVAAPDLTPAENRQVFETALGNFFVSPDYLFRQSEGIKALDRSAAARGRLQSGAQLKAVNEFGQNLAASEFGNYRNVLASLAGIGQTETNNIARYGANATANVGNALVGAGNARASGFSNTGGIINNSIENYLKSLAR